MDTQASHVPQLSLVSQETQLYDYSRKSKSSSDTVLLDQKSIPDLLTSSSDPEETMECKMERHSEVNLETLPKAQRTQGLSSSSQSNLMGYITSSNTNLDQISSS